MTDDFINRVRERKNAQDWQSRRRALFAANSAAAGQQDKAAPKRKRNPSRKATD